MLLAVFLGVAGAMTLVIYRLSTVTLLVEG